MAQQFNHPQRQSKIGIVVMFLYALQKFVRALFPLLVVFFIRFEKLNLLYVTLGVIGFLVFLGIFSYLKYLNFTFYIDDENDEFILNEGIINKTKTTIQLNKIQQVNINQSFIQKIIGVYALEVDTAGSTQKEGSINAIPHDLAISLKARLLENEKIVTEISEETEAEVSEFVIKETEPFIKISLLTLFKIGITSNYLRSVALLFLVYSTIQENIRNFSQQDYFDGSQLDNYFAAQSIIKAVLMVGLLLIVVVLIVNILRTVIKFFGFNISKQKGSLLINYGLFSTKSTIIKPEKVQITTVTRNFFQKKMDILEIKIQQASSGEIQNKKDIIEIPGCNEEEKNEILKLIFNTFPEKGVMLKPNWRKLVFSLFTGIIIPILFYVGFGMYLEPWVFDYAFLAVGYIIFVAVILFFAFKNNRLFVNDDFIIAQSGVWDVDNRIIEVGKIQALTTSQLFWHKTADIGSLTIHTAGGDMHFALGNFTKVKHYVNLWLYKVETKNRHWM